MDGQIVVPAEGFGGQTKEQVEAAIAAQAAPKVVANVASPAGLIAGKYKTPEELLKGYKNAESELGRLRAELATLRGTPAPVTPVATVAPAVEPETPAEPVAPVVPAADTLEIPEPVEAPAEDPAATVVDFDVYAQEFAKTGALSAETYTKLAAQGISKQMTDTYIAGIQASKANALAAADKIAGGAEARTQVLAWAATNLSAAERNAFNETVAGNDPAARELVFRGLVSRWKESGGGAEPNLVQAQGRSPAAGGIAFANFKELSAAMKDPRYATDPAYRATVEQRANISPL